MPHRGDKAGGGWGRFGRGRFGESGCVQHHVVRAIARGAVGRFGRSFGHGLVPYHSVRVKLYYIPIVRAIVVCGGAAFVILGPGTALNFLTVLREVFGTSPTTSAQPRD